MKLFSFLSFLFVSITMFGQANPDQNPNHEASYQKYVKSNTTYLKQQGTTAQQTYVAIDPIEEKRIRKNIRKNHRANRRLWRHEERLARAKNTRYYRHSYSNLGVYGGLGFGALNYGLFNNRRFRGSSLGCSYYIR